MPKKRNYPRNIVSRVAPNQTTMEFLDKSEIFYEAAIEDRMANALGFIKSRLTLYPNGRPMFQDDGLMLDDQGNRSIFHDVNK